MTPLATDSPIETKVTAASGGATAGVVVSAFVVWLLQQYVFHGSDVPVPVQGMVLLVVSVLLTTGATFVAGWLAPHTARPDLPGPAR